MAQVSEKKCLRSGALQSSSGVQGQPTGASKGLQPSCAMNSAQGAAVGDQAAPGVQGGPTGVSGGPPPGLCHALGRGSRQARLEAPNCPVPCTWQGEPAGASGGPQLPCAMHLAGGAGRRVWRPPTALRHALGRAGRGLPQFQATPQAGGPWVTKRTARAAAAQVLTRRGSATR